MGRGGGVRENTDSVKCFEEAAAQEVPHISSCSVGGDYASLGVLREWCSSYTGLGWPLHVPPRAFRCLLFWSLFFESGSNFPFRLLSAGQWAPWSDLFTGFPQYLDGVLFNVSSLDATFIF